MQRETAIKEGVDMTYDEFYAKYSSEDHALLRLTDVFPFFDSKVIVDQGIKTEDKKYHIADGMFSTYINFEMPHGGLSAEISGTMRFEICLNTTYPVFITNVGKEPLEFRIDDSIGEIKPKEVFAIYPEKLKAETCEELDEQLFERVKPKLTQDEIIRLLDGYLTTGLLFFIFIDCIIRL